jgi:general secretion pathway protein N
MSTPQRPFRPSPLAVGRKPSSNWRWAATGALVGGLLSVFMNMPAQWLASALWHLSKGQIQVQEAEGSVWLGSGKLVLTGGAGSRDAMALPGRLQWQVQGLYSFNSLPSIQMNITAACCMKQAMPMQLSRNTQLAAWRLQVGAHVSQWPAQLLSGLGAPWNTLQPEGRLILQTQPLVLDFQQGKTGLQGSATLTAEDVSSKLSTLKPMGSYLLSLVSESAAQGGPALSLVTQSGSLLLSGQGQWHGAQFQFRGEATAVPEHAEALSNLLNIIGRREGTRSLLSLG